MIHSGTSDASPRGAPTRTSDPDILLELHRELWAAQRRQAATTPGTRARLDADAAVSWFEWLLVDYLQEMARSGASVAPPRRRPAARPAA